MGLLSVRQRRFFVCRMNKISICRRFMKINHHSLRVHFVSLCIRLAVMSPLFSPKQPLCMHNAANNALFILWEHACTLSRLPHYLSAQSRSWKHWVINEKRPDDSLRNIRTHYHLLVDVCVLSPRRFSKSTPECNITPLSVSINLQSLLAQYPLRR